MNRPCQTPHFPIPLGEVVPLTPFRGAHPPWDGEVAAASAMPIDGVGAEAFEEEPRSFDMAPVNFLAPGIMLSKPAMSTPLSQEYAYAATFGGLTHRAFWAPPAAVRAPSADCVRERLRSYAHRVGGPVMEPICRILYT